MAIESTHPAHAINRFLWAQIEAEGLMTKYNGITPLVPVEETPELMTVIDSLAGVKSYPYIVFTWSKIPGGPDWFLKENEVAYAIRSADDPTTRKLINLFERLFQDYDQAAHRVNSYVNEFGAASHKRFTFKEIHLSTLGGQMPAERDAGINEALISIRTVYTEQRF